MVNRIERKPERNNKIYVKRVYPGINMPTPIYVEQKYVFQEKPKMVEKPQPQVVVPTQPISEVMLNNDIVDESIKEEPVSKSKKKKTEIIEN